MIDPLGLFRAAVARGYSLTADRLYDTLVIRGTLPRLGGADYSESITRQAIRAAQISGGGPILDLPVGTAHFTIATARAHDGVVVGADLAEGMVRKAAQTADGANVRNLAPVRCDAHRLPFADDSFAAITCANGLPVIPGLRRTLSELSRVLRPGGTLFVAMVTLPVGAALPPELGRRLPAALQSPRELETAFAQAGLTMVLTGRSRLGLSLEATKASPTRS